MAKQDKWYLECKKGSSNKFYEITISRSRVKTFQWTVNTQHGPIGATPRPGIRKIFDIYSEARGYANKVMYQKQIKGYIEVDKKSKKAKTKTTTKEKRMIDSSLKRFSTILAE